MRQVFQLRSGRDRFLVIADRFIRFAEVIAQEKPAAGQNGKARVDRAVALLQDCMRFQQVRLRRQCDRRFDRAAGRVSRNSTPAVPLSSSNARLARSSAVSATRIASGRRLPARKCIELIVENVPKLLLAFHRSSPPSLSWLDQPSGQFFRARGRACLLRSTA